MTRKNTKGEPPEKWTEREDAKDIKKLCEKKEKPKS